MDQWVDSILRAIAENRAWAAAIVFGLAFAESMVLISIAVPFTAIIIGAGTLLCGNTLDPWTLLPAGIAGAAAGDAVSYWVGRYFDVKVARIWPFSRNPDLLARGHRFFERWGILAVFIGRFFGPLRAVVPTVAGMMDMPHLRFQLANVGSAILWLPVVMAPGYLACTVLSNVTNLSEKVFLYVFVFFTGGSLVIAAIVALRGWLKKRAAARSTGSETRS